MGHSGLGRLATAGVIVCAISGGFVPSAAASQDVGKTAAPLNPFPATGQTVRHPIGSIASEEAVPNPLPGGLPAGQAPPKMPAAKTAADGGPIYQDCWEQGFVSYPGFPLLPRTIQWEVQNFCSPHVTAGAANTNLYFDGDGHYEASGNTCSTPADCRTKGSYYDIIYTGFSTRHRLEHHVIFELAPNYYWIPYDGDPSSPDTYCDGWFTPVIECETWWTLTVPVN